MKEAITIKDVRSALLETSSVNEDDLKDLSDEDLLEEDLITDLGLTSLDMIDLTLELERDLNILLDDTDRILDDLKDQGSYKVKDFIKTCNNNARSKTLRF